MGWKINPLYSDEVAILEICKENEMVFGPLWEQKLARALQWFTVILSAIFLAYYVYSTLRATCGWEELYVCTVEFTKVVVEVYLEYVPPFMIYQMNGQHTPWLRYMEWLLTCPVILIHLSNITGLNDEYSGRTMSLLTSDLGGIAFAVLSALAVGWQKGLYFGIGCIYGASTFYHAACIYIESYHTMPAGKCKRLVVAMCAVFFTSWFMFPALFLAGPECFDGLTWSGSTIAHTVADLLSKNIWGLIGHFLRVGIHEHILVHGDVRRPIEVTIFGKETSLNCFVENDDEEDDV
nr:TcChR [synthetic construct]